MRAQGEGFAGPAAEGGNRAVAIYRWDGELADRQEEAAYLTATWNIVLSRARIAVAASAMFLAATAIDFLHQGPSLVYFQLLIARIAVCAACLAPVALCRTGRTASAFFAGMAVCEALIFSVAMAANWANGEDFAVTSISAFAIVAVFYFGVPGRLVLTAPIAIACSAAQLGMSYLVFAPPLTTMGMLVLCWIALHLVGIQTMRIATQLRRSEHRTIRQYRSLTGRLRREMNDRRQAEGKARSSEENFSLVFRAAPIPLALVRPKSNRILQANKAALDLFEIPEEEVNEVDLEGFFGADDGGGSLARIGRLLSTQGNTELKLNTYKGAEFWAQLSGVAIRYRGEPAVLLGFHDVTERRREAETLKQARDEATAANKSKSEFLANMSHELRTPLNAIIGFSEAIEREMYGPVGNIQYREYAADIYESGVHLLTVINDILDLSKIESGRFDLSEHEVDIGAVFKSAAVIVRPRAAEAAVQLLIEAPDEDYYLFADERALKQVLINLLTNAVKFSPENSAVRLSAKRCPEGVRICVADEGVGMAPEDIPRALEPFTQIDGSLARNHEGTGLGLPLAKRLVELHGGELKIESEPGKGTAVTIFLPAGRVAEYKATEEREGVVWQV
ncbi:sensor histidine kinase [Tepidicaulis sp. LMO-SS28]|uniref:sensor histidine kinase n=1 Tax=Tepidicaulis sp. LMO-SS28 TaxID=3447455 RepID=UPI003EE12DCA